MTTESTSTGGLGDEVRQRAGTAVHEATSKGREAVDKGRAVVEGQVDTRSTQAGDKLSSVADTVHDTSDNLREQGNDTAARLVEQLATYTERAADYLRNSDAGSIIDDVERYARKQPWAVALGALVGGFAGARVLRASRSHAASTSSQGSGLRDHSRDIDAPAYSGGYGTGYVEGSTYGTGYASGYGSTFESSGTAGATTGAAESWADPLATGTPAVPATPGYQRGDV